MTEGSDGIKWRGRMADSNDADAWDDLGLYLGSHGRLEEAIAAFRQAVHLKPDFAMAWNNLAMVFHEAGRIKAAAEAMRRFDQLWKRLKNQPLAPPSQVTG